MTSNTLRTAEADGIEKTGIETEADGVERIAWLGKVPEFSSEKERTKFIDGDRQKRISLDNEDIQEFLQELSRETAEANNNLEKITGFYYDLENFIRSQNVGGVGFLIEDVTSDNYTGDHRLCFEDIPNPDVAGDYKYTSTFWRIGYCKIGSSWHLAALRYKINPIDGPKPQHEHMGEPIRLTHAPRELRLQAAHHIRDLLMLILENVRYHKNGSESALNRIAPLRKSVQAFLDAGEPQ
jgi:hypothetical protein